MELIAVSLVVALVSVAVAVPYMMTRMVKAMIADVSASIGGMSASVARAIGESVQTALAPAPLAPVEKRPEAEHMPAFEYEADNNEDGKDYSDHLLRDNGQFLVGVSRGGVDANMDGIPNPFGIPGLVTPKVEVESNGR